jgi:hypothetical protein
LSARYCTTSRNGGEVTRGRRSLLADLGRGVRRPRQQPGSLAQSAPCAPRARALQERSLFFGHLAHVAARRDLAALLVDLALCLDAVAWFGGSV